MELLTKLGDCFLSKLLEKSVEYARGKRDKTTFESLQNNVRLLCAKASDVDVAIKAAKLSGGKKRKREVQEWLEQVQVTEGEFQTLLNEIETEGFAKRFFRGGQATKLDARVNELVEQAKNFGELVLDDCNVQGVEFLTKGLVGKEFDKNLKKIWSFLVNKNVSSIGIYGMGGAGKTTLAKHINNRLLKRSQEHIVWVTVSQVFSVHMLQDKIAKELGLDLSGEYDEDKRATRLNKALSKKKNMVLIFDDIWKSFDLIKVGDPFSIHGCRLMITTRSREVCRQIGCREEIEVKTLKEKEPWKLFKEKLGREMSLTHEVKTIAKSMVKLCGGLPLAIITLAGSMKGETECHAWRDAFAELRKSIMGQEDMEENVYKVLKYSFDRLNRGEAMSHGYSKIQHCFLFCAFYPEDFPINRWRLIRMFIMEGFLDKRKRREELFDQGNRILDKLVNVCLLEKVNKDTLKMHDLLRSMALKIDEARTKLMCKSGGSFDEIMIEEHWTEDLNKIYCGPDAQQTPFLFEMTPKCPNLSTMLLANFRFLPDSFFSQMHSLCILDFSECHYMNKLPDSVSDLKSLKALILYGCFRLKVVPYLGKLRQLRELDFTSTSIEKVPHGMEELTKLEFLSLEYICKLKMLPRGLLSNFQCLKCLYLERNIAAPAEEMQKLKQLEEFRGRVEYVTDFHMLRSMQSLAYGVEVGSLTPYCSVVDRNRGYNGLVLTKYEFKESKEEDAIWLSKGIRHLTLYRCEGLSSCLVDDLLRLHIDQISLESLKIVKCDGTESSLKRERFVLGGAVASTPTYRALAQSIFLHLKVLQLYQCNKIKRLGLSSSKFPNIEAIDIEWCEMIEEVMEVVEVEGNTRRELGRVMDSPPLAEAVFPLLKELRIQHCEKIRRLDISPSKFPNLEKIDIGFCEMIEEVMEVVGDNVRGESGRVMDSGPPAQSVFSHLKELKIDSCHKIKMLRMSPSHIPNLKKIHVEGCGMIEEIMELTEGIGGGLREVVSLPKLKSLVLLDLPQLKSICNATLVCSSIVTIQLKECPALKKVPLVFGEPNYDSAPSTLQEIELYDHEWEWWMALELGHPTHHVLLEPFIYFESLDDTGLVPVNEEGEEGDEEDSHVEDEEEEDEYKEENVENEGYPVKILDTKVRDTRNQSVEIVKILWSRHGRGEDVTWELADKIRDKYPELFLNS